MSRSIQITPDAVPAAQAETTPVASHDNVHVHASRSRQVNVVPSEPSATTVRTGAERVPVGADLATTYGAAKVHRSVQGLDIVTLPGGTQLTMEEAKATGILNVPQERAKEPPADPGRDQKQGKAEAKSAGEDADGPGEDSDDPADEVSLEDYASSIDGVADALTAQGIDPVAAIGNVISAQANADGDSIVLPDDVSSALVATLGQEGAAEALENISGHIEQELHSAIAASGLTFADEAQLDAFANYVDTAPASAWISLLQGNSAALRNHISNFNRTR